MVRTSIVVNSLSGELLLGPQIFDEVIAVRKSIQTIWKREGVTLVHGCDMLEDNSELPGGDLSLTAIVQTLSEEERAQCLQLVNAQPRLPPGSLRGGWRALLTDLPAPARDDSVVMAAAARRYEGALHYASKVACDDPELLRVSVTSYPQNSVLTYASDRLLADRTFVIPMMLQELRVYQGVEIKLGMAFVTPVIFGASREVAAMVSALLWNMVPVLLLMGVVILFMMNYGCSNQQFLWQAARWLFEDALLMAIACFWSHKFPEDMAFGQSLLSKVGHASFSLALLACSVRFGRSDRPVRINSITVGSIALLFLLLAGFAEAVRSHVFRVLLAFVLILASIFYISRQAQEHPVLFTISMIIGSWQCAGLNLDFEHLTLLLQAMFAWLWSYAVFASSGVAALQFLQLHIATAAS